VVVILEWPRKPSTNRRRRAGGLGASKQVCDHFGGRLVAMCCELLQRLGVLALNAEDDRELRVGVADVGLDVAWVDLGEVRVEVAGLGIRLCPGVAGCAHLLGSLRLRGEEPEPATIGRVVGCAEPDDRVLAEARVVALPYLACLMRR